ncbi:MAG: 4'-phosphopantetheinyl transferase superfamily protein [Blastocatellia bacterium]
MNDGIIEALWGAPPSRLKISGSEVHIWRAALDRSPDCEERLLATLTEDEQNRASRFYHKHDRSHYISARGILRDLLGRYLDARPGALRFEYTKYGKPSLIKEFGGETLRFNLSHSKGVALFAFTTGRELGIDVEWIRADVADEQIAERFFSAQEVRTLRGLEASAQAEGFFNCWTRKEAYIKARGEGLSMPLDRFAVSLEPGDAAALLYTDGGIEETSRWRLLELFPGPGFAGAVAVEGHDWQLNCWRWEEPAP